MFENVLSLAIRLAAAAVILGWGLSAAGHLDARGYLLAGLPVLGLVLYSVDWKPWARFGRLTLRRPLLWWRRGQLLPLAFLLISALIFLGSALHEPNNFDGLNYRAPKVLHWLAAHRWHWIHDSCPFINYTFPNYEWLTVPFYAVTHGFHATVLINWLAFALLPGLFFSLLRSLGARPRAAFQWMWLFPSAYIVGMEAGGIGNDLVGLTAVLASLHCANRFNATNKGGDLLNAVLAAGFCTGVKISNLPLGGLIGIVLLREPLRLLAHRAMLAVAAVLGLACSGFFPLLLNRLNTGSILGAAAGQDQTTNPVAGWLGNLLELLVTGLMPPLGGSHATAWLDAHTAGPLGWVHAHYEKFTLHLNDLPQEEGGGFGLGITLGVLLCFALWWKLRPQSRVLRQKALAAAPGNPSAFQLLGWQRKLLWGWVLLTFAVILARLGLGPAMPRATMAWLAVLLALMLAPLCTEALARARLWRLAAPWLTLSIVPALLLTPSRPLVPPSAIVRLGHKLRLSEPSLQQIQTVYDVYARRSDMFVELRQDVPPETSLLAVVSDGFDSTAAYWKPYGQRRAVDWLSDQEVRATLAQAKQPVYVVLKEEGCQKFFNCDIATWLKRYHATPIKSVDMRVLASHPLHHFTLARLDPAVGP